MQIKTIMKQHYLTIRIARKYLNLTMPSINDMTQLELSYFAGENEASTTILEKILEDAYTVKHALAI